MSVINTQRGRIRAVLGPTNTGKTHLAIERMLGHTSGMIGFPLRLLARENYDRICRLKGVSSVALITGEEKIIPANPRWYVCTVESMPLDKMVEFLAVDEIQLCADRDRGHIFTDRLLHARGLEETMFLGADTIADLIKLLVPEAEIESRPRFSTLSYVGSKKLTRLPRRCAVVAFSVNDVYALAETIRQHRGGTAVVLGALSPRTRNAQVDMYQAGEVDYLVATDAIGMGLNMDVDHVAFAATRKYDGHAMRPLSAAEVGQIGGRAGRHMNDGSFGVTNNLHDFDEDLVEAVENHEFQKITQIQWRNRRLDFRSPKLLIRSLQHGSSRRELVRTRDAEDHLTLLSLMRNEEVMQRADGTRRMQMLWDLCQVPDFRKVTPDHHAELVGDLFIQLCDHGRIPDDFLAGRIDRLDKTEGDIDMLTQRLAYIRTWAYVANRQNWLRDAVHWQERTRAIEDMISDALHDRLMQRFVDKRATALNRKGKDTPALFTAIGKDNQVLVEGHIVGRITGFRFQPDRARDAREAKALHTAAAPAFAQEMADRVAKLEKAEDKDIHLTAQGIISWGEIEIARLRKGRDLLEPSVELTPNDIADGGLQARIVTRLEKWLQAYLADRLRILIAPKTDKMSPPARGLLFQLREGLGSCRADQAREQTGSLTEEDRILFAKMGLRMGRDWIYLERLLKPAAIRLRAILWAAFHDVELPAIPAKQRFSLPGDMATTDAWAHLGYGLIGPVALRQDRVERFSAMLRKLAKTSPFTIPPEMMQITGCTETDVRNLLRGMGGKRDKETGEWSLHVKGRKRRKNVTFQTKDNHGAKGKIKRHSRKSKSMSESDSPFAALKGLLDKQ